MPDPQIEFEEKPDFLSHTVPRHFSLLPMRRWGRCHCIGCLSVRHPSQTEGQGSCRALQASGHRNPASTVRGTERRGTSPLQGARWPCGEARQLKQDGYDATRSISNRRRHNPVRAGESSRLTFALLPQVLITASRLFCCPAMPQTIQPPSRQFTRPIAHGFWRGAHFSATLGYKERQEEKCKAALQDLADEAQELDLGY